MHVDLSTDLVSLVSLFIATATLYFTIKIPERMMWAQIYSSLNTEYRSHEFGKAVKGIIDFFHDECDCDLDKIEDEYRKRYDNEFDDKGKFLKQEDKGLNDVGDTLHFQRRMVAQFYMQLDMCMVSCAMVKRLIKKDYNKSETNLIKILYYMGKASSGYDRSYKNINTYDPLIPTKVNETQLDKHLTNLYKFFKKNIGE